MYAVQHSLQHTVHSAASGSSLVSVMYVRVIRLFQAILSMFKMCGNAPRFLVVLFFLSIYRCFNGVCFMETILTPCEAALPDT
jgi:hypothetical protein